MGTSNYHTKVISSKGKGWQFFDYVEGETNPIEDWFQKDLSEDGQELFRSLLKNYSKIDDHLQWSGWRGYLQGELKEFHIWEFGFIADRRQYRILGIFAGEKRAVLLIGCYHKGRVYTPAASLETAYKRAKALEQKKGALYERKIDVHL